MSESHEKKISFKKGEVIFCEDEPGETVFFIQSGEVKLVKVVSDKEKTLAILREKDIMGEMSVLKKTPRTATAVAYSDTVLLEFDRDSFFKLVQKAPQIGLKMLTSFANRLADQKRKLKTITIPTKEGRILDALLIFVEKGQGKILSEKSAQIKTNYHELAGWAAISESECRDTLQHLNAINKIKILDEENIVIENIDMVKTFLLGERKKTG